MLTPFLKKLQKYAEIVTFGASLGISGYLCSTGVMTQCVSAATLIKTAVFN